jgi:phage terminase small subunit
MPRKSAAALAVAPTARVDGRPAALVMPAGLSDPARAVWVQAVAAVPPEHFRVSDVPLLRSYCESTAMADQASAALARDGFVVDGKASPWLVVQEKAIRAQATLALRLRLCPSARTDPKTTGRERQTYPVVDFSELEDK